MARQTQITAIVIGAVILYAGGVITGLRLGDAGQTGIGTTLVQITEEEPKVDEARAHRRSRPRPAHDRQINRLRNDGTVGERLQSTQNTPTPRPRIEIGEVETKTIETNEAYHRISYLVIVRNNTSRTIQEANLYVDFLDTAGFVLLSHLDFVRLEPGDNTLRGLLLLDTPWALQKPAVEARVEAD